MSSGKKKSKSEIRTNYCAASLVLELGKGVCSLFQSPKREKRLMLLWLHWCFKFCISQRLLQVQCRTHFFPCIRQDLQQEPITPSGSMEVSFTAWKADATEGRKAGQLKNYTTEHSKKQNKKQNSNAFL